MHLQQGTLLQGGKYKIERFIASGGFGCTYEAYHTLLDMRVALKEFFVSDFCNRDERTGQVSVATKSKVELIGKLKKKFMDEARALYKMKHPGIVRVTDVFEENGTAYYAMEYIDGQSLSDVVKQRGQLPEAEAVGYIRQVAEALKHVHSLNRLHLDIKPGNIMLGREGKAILIDFGASKHYDAETGENTSTLLAINTKGYAPVEQVNQSFKSFSPATDIYALGATLYKLLTGITPPPSTLLHSEEATLAPLPSTISPATRKAVESAMQLLRKHRPQTVEAWMAMLVDEEKTNEIFVELDPTPAPKPKPQPAPKPNPQPAPGSKPARLSGWKWIISGVAAAAIIISVAIWQSGRNEPSDINDNDSIAANQTNAEESKVEYTTSTLIPITVNGVTFNMIKVDGGTFTMGATSEQNNPYDDEKPTHQVTLSTYYIGETEVTQELWTAVMGNNPSWFEGDNLPVEEVSWEDCQTFIGKLNGLTGKRFRLPTEAEWEYAARGGKRSNHTQYSGGSMIDGVAWYGGNSGRKTHSVKTKKPNELGLYDMSGNVWEWCHSSNAQTNPKGRDSGSSQVLRGGGWNDCGKGCRSSYRSICSPGNRGNVGFRLALSE